MQAVREIIDFWRFLFRRFLDDQAFNSAAALTYTTLFAVVPMMTVTFTMLSAIPAFQGVGEEVQEFVFRNFMPSAGETVQSYLSGFTKQARQLTWVGVAVLAVTAFTMLLTIEKTFNTIWRVRQARRGVSSFLLYWAILSLGPLLLGAGFVASTYVASLSLISGPNALIGGQVLLAGMPLLSSVLAFTLLYATVPNARVSFKHALLGGAFAAVLFEVAKSLFALYVSIFPGYQLIYGAFATVPLFLLWLYVSWLIVLFGAEMVCNLSFNRLWHQRALPPLLVAMGVLRLFYERQVQGQAIRYADVQGAGWPMPEDQWNALLDFFEQQNLVAPAGQDRWVLCRDLSQYSVRQLLEHSPWPLPRVEQLPEQLDEPWFGALVEALLAMQAQRIVLLEVGLGPWLQQASERPVAG